MTTKIRKGQYVVCRYAGTGNGDLIVGVVDSVRSKGRVVLTNLLTNTTSIKKEDVLLRRNAFVPKRLAMPIVKAFKASNDKARARSMAIEAARKAAHTANGQTALGLSAAPGDAIDDMVKRFQTTFSKEEQMEISRRLWGDALKLFGVK